MAKPRSVIDQPSDPSVRLIALTRDMVVAVDAADYEDANMMLWMASCFDGKWYAARTIRIDGKKTTLLLHRYLLGLKPGDGILADHKNGNGLDCRRNNLRHGRPDQNSQNRMPWKNGASRFKGVRPYYYKPWLWMAEIRLSGKTKTLGVFVLEEDAARAYDTAALENYGEFAWLNFPESRSANGPV